VELSNYGLQFSVSVIACFRQLSRSDIPREAKEKPPPRHSRAAWPLGKMLMPRLQLILIPYLG
jgi:hypothetical protein